MEQQHAPEQRPTEITLYLKSQDLVPDPADIERRRERLAETAGLNLPYTLGWLIASVEGIADGILVGDGRRVSERVRAGLAAIAAHESVTAEQRQTFDTNR